METERTNCLQNILQSDSPKKVIVSGPGTGKTYTFSRVLELDPSNNLVITFINNLVNDMQESIGHLAEVRTFHSLSLKELHSKPFLGIDSEFQFYPLLAYIIAIDSDIIFSAGLIGDNYDKNQLENAFRLLEENENIIDFFLLRANFYNSVGFDDSVYRVLKRFESRPETIPNYNNVLVDEYQDFNLLEVEFISHLEMDSDTLIVGDDDQAIYQFRGASPNYLREKTKDSDYELFPLPFCSRCTDIIIKSVNSIVENAQDIGLMLERIPKEFTCYLPEKKNDSDSFPFVKKVTCSVNTKKSPYIAKYIESQISSISEEEIKNSIDDQYPLILIVGPSHYLNQIHEYLYDRFPNVEYKPRVKSTINILDGYKYLIENDKSNLGWRILVECISENDLNNIVVDSYKSNTPIYELLDNEFLNDQLSLITDLGLALEDPDKLTKESIDNIESSISQSLIDVLEVLHKPHDDENQDNQDQSDYDGNNPKILLTTYSGCKGLSSGFTFVTGLEENVFPKQNDIPKYSEICQYIVSMTRTRKECHLIHTNRFAGVLRDKSIFFDWIPNDYCQVVEVNKSFF